MGTLNLVAAVVFFKLLFGIILALDFVCYTSQLSLELLTEH